MAGQEPILELIDYDTLPPDLQAAVDRERKLVAGGVPLPTAAQPGPMFTKPIVPPGMGEGFGLPKWSDIAKLGLPAGGGALGGRLLSRFGSLPRALGMGAGSAAGTAASQQAGLEAPSPEQIALSGVLGGAPGLFRAGVLGAPGAQAGRQAASLEKVGYAGTKPGAVLPLARKHIPVPVPSKDLYAEVAAKGGINVPVTHVSDAIAGLRESFTLRGEKLVDPASKRMVEGIDSLLKVAGTTPGTARFSNLQEAMQFLRKQARSTALSPDARRTARTLEDGIWEAMKQAGEHGSGPAIEALKAANKAYKREVAQGELSKLLNDARSTIGGVEQVLGDRALTKFLKTEASFARRLDAAEVADIKETLRELAKVPGLQSGMISFAQRAMVSGGLGAALGGPPGAAGGVLATELLAKGLTAAPSRGIIKLLAKHGAGFDEIGNALLQLWRAGLLAETTEQAIKAEGQRQASQAQLEATQAETAQIEQMLRQQGLPVPR